MNNNRQVTNLVALDKVSVDLEVLTDFMNSFDNLEEDNSSHLEIYLMNLRSSLVEHKEVGEVHVVPMLDKEERIL